jgi:uncharacterized protein
MLRKSFQLLLASVLAFPLLGNARDAEVSLPHTRVIEFTSHVNGHRYSMMVATPLVGRPPAKGYGVLYVLDGYWLFSTATEFVRGFGNPMNVVVVGLSYPEDPKYLQHVLEQRAPLPDSLRNFPAAFIAPQVERRYDFTLPASDAQLAAQIELGTPPPRSAAVGGVDDFLKTIETEVKPRVAALAPIDPSNQALFGHSLGGLAALHALFVEPDAFRTFIISSPSIWWNDKAVLADETRFSKAVTAGETTPRVLVSVGGEESTVPALVPPSWGIDRDALATTLQQARMVQNSRDLVSRLKALHGHAGYVVADFALFDASNHAAAQWHALARGIPFAFGDTPAGE